ncbi:hypothetical protein HaLaN_02303, partial [Haematococcus lacustris]
MDDLMRLLVPAEKAEKAAHGARDMVSPTGISLAYLFRLGEALPPHTRAMSTYQVAQTSSSPAGLQELMHLTQASQCRLLDRCPAQCRALPKYFIIHCWQAQFHHTVAQLRSYELWVAMRLPPKSKFLQCEDRLHIVAYEPNWLHFAGLLVGLRLDGTKASRVPDQQRLLQELKEDPELVPKQEQVGSHMLQEYTSAATQRALMLAAGGHMWEAEKAHTEAERVAKRVLASATPGAAPGAGGLLAETETEPGKGQSGTAPSRGYILSLRHMAAIKARASQMDRALQYQRHALFLAEKHLPMQHMDLGAIRSELAQLLHSTGQHAVALEVVNKALAVAAQLQGQLAGDLVPLQVLRTHCLIALGQLADAHAQAVALYHAAHSARLGCATSTSAHHGRFKHEDQLHTSAIRVSEKAVEAVRDAWVRSGRALLQRDPGAELEAASRLTSGLLLQLKLQAHAPCVDNQQLCEELEEETARVLSRL